MPKTILHHFFQMFSEYCDSIYKYLKKDNWYFWAEMKSGSTTLPIFQSLEAFWPGVEVSE